MINKVEVVIKVRISPEIAFWLEKQKLYRQKGNVTSRALEFFYDYLYNRKGFLIRLIDVNFEEIKHLLRKIGNIKRKL